MIQANSLSAFQQPACQLPNVHEANGIVRMTAAAVTCRFGGHVRASRELDMPLVVLEISLPHHEHRRSKHPDINDHGNGSKPPGKYCNLDGIIYFASASRFVFQCCMSSARLRCFTPLQTHLSSPAFKRVSPFQIPRNLPTTSNNLSIRTMASVSKAGQGTKCVYSKPKPCCRADMRQDCVYLEYR